MWSMKKFSRKVRFTYPESGSPQKVPSKGNDRSSSMSAITFEVDTIDILVL